MTEQTTVIPGEVEDVESFRQRARSWIKANLARTKETAAESGEGGGGMDFSDEAWLRARELQKLLYKGGFAGICYPKEYGGLGLQPGPHKGFKEGVAGHPRRRRSHVPT